MLRRLGVILVSTPNKDGIAVSSSQDDVFAGSDELGLALSSWPFLAAVVAQIEGEAGLIAVFRDVPIRFNRRRSLI